MDVNSNNKPSDEPNIETATVPISVSGIILDTLPTLVPQDFVTSVITVEPALTNSTRQLAMTEDTSLMEHNTVPVQGQIVTSRPSSAAPIDFENSKSNAMNCTANAINENIVKLQQKKIEQLQQELERIKMQVLQKLQDKQQAQQHIRPGTQPIPIAPALSSPHVSTMASTSSWHSQVLQKARQRQNAQQQILPGTQPVPIAPALSSSHLFTMDTKAFQQYFQQVLQRAVQQQDGNGGKFAPGSPAMSAVFHNLHAMSAAFHNQQGNSVRMPSTGTSVNQPNAVPYSNFKNNALYPQPLQTLVKQPRANLLPNAQQELVRMEGTYRVPRKPVLEGLRPDVSRDEVIEKLEYIREYFCQSIKSMEEEMDECRSADSKRELQHHISLDKEVIESLDAIFLKLGHR